MIPANHGRRLYQVNADIAVQVQAYCNGEFGSDLSPDGLQYLCIGGAPAGRRQGAVQVQQQAIYLPFHRGQACNDLAHIFVESRIACRGGSTGTGIDYADRLYPLLAAHL